MKDIQLCGMGNGLVDLQYMIPTETMAEFGMMKGEMRLIDDNERNRINEFFNEHNYTICSGGSAANSVIAFAQLGGKAAYSTVLGNDDFGHFYASEFRELNIELSADIIENNPTGTCYIFIAPDSERTMLTYLGATAQFSTKNVDEDIIARSEWVYIEGYKFSQQSSTDAVYKAIDYSKKHNTKIAFTFSDVFITENFRENVEKAYQQADLVFCNANEAMSFTGENSFENAKKKIFDSIENAVITNGEKGSSIKMGNEIFDIPAYPATPLDSTGAGDMFAGAFLYGMIVENDIHFAGHLASLCSAKIVSKLGARMDDNYDEIKQQIRELL